MFNNNDYKYYYKILKTDVFGRITKSFHGNGLVTNKTYDLMNGKLHTITTGYNGDNDIRDIEYQYDSLNNVTSKIDHKQDITQSYQYDSLDRIIQANTITQNENTTLTYNYDALGNITHKSDVGDYTYHTNTHQVATIGSNIAYTYDANGNVTQKTKDGKTTNITYNGYNKPILLEDENTTTRFYYNPDRSRYKKTQADTTTYYISKHYEEEISSTTILQKNFIYAGKELVAIHTETDDGTLILPGNRYLHKDSLGSIDTITNESGIVIQRLAYNPFGNQIIQDWINDNYANTPLVKRGYTGHEHIKEFNLIHMNGRVYDPDTGRFLSADPYIQFPDNTQSYCRYSYVLNNPLKYTDPSGFFSLKKAFKGVTKFFKKEGKKAIFGIVTKSTLENFHNNIFLTTDPGAQVLHSKPVKKFFIKYRWARTAATIVASYFGGPIGAAAANAYFTEIMGGSFNDMLKAAVIAYASAYVASEIGDAFGHDASFLAEGGGGTGYASVTTGYANAAMKAVVHGVSRAAFAKAQGQNVSAAFWSGFISSGFAAPHSYGEIGGTFVTIIVGGTTSEISGGKFANGAVTAAYIHLFNAMGDGYYRAIHKTKKDYKYGAQYGDASKEVIRSAVKGAISDGWITKSVQGAALGGATGALQEAALQQDNLMLDIETTGKIVDEIVYDTADEIIEYENAIKNDTLDWGD